MRSGIGSASKASCSRTRRRAQCGRPAELAAAEVGMRRGRRVGLGGGVLLGLVALATPAWCDEIYQWTGPDGSVHYSNTPTSGASSTRLPDVARSAPDTAVAPDSPAAAAAAEADAFATQAS